MSEIIREEANGFVSITDDAIASIAAVAAEEVEGVLASSNIIGDLVEKFGKKNAGKNIKVDIDGDTVNVEIHVVLKYGANIPKICDELQNKISSSVDIMTGLKVKSVNVYIENVVMEKEKKAPKTKKTAEE